MTLIACSLGLFVIYAGAKLLIQTKLETPGRFYKFISRFLLLMGFFIVIASIGSFCIGCLHSIPGNNQSCGFECPPCGSSMFDHVASCDEGKSSMRQDCGHHANGKENCASSRAIGHPHAIYGSAGQTSGCHGQMKESCCNHDSLLH